MKFKPPAPSKGRVPKLPKITPWAPPALPKKGKLSPASAAMIRMKAARIMSGGGVPAGA